jgi:hypothetical protein
MTLEKGRTRRNSFFEVTRGGSLRVAGVHISLQTGGDLGDGASALVKSKEQSDIVFTRSP